MSFPRKWRSVLRQGPPRKDFTKLKRSSTLRMELMLFNPAVPSWQKSSPTTWSMPRGRRLRRVGVLSRSATRHPIGKISAKCCSFSVVSAPIFTSKYAFCSIFQNLPEYLADIFEIWQILQILDVTVCKILLNWNFTKIADFSNRFFC